MPSEEINYLKESRLEWLFSINLAEGQTEALLAIGPKRSESPYSREDQELLEGIASSLALLLASQRLDFRAETRSRGGVVGPASSYCSLLGLSGGPKDKSKHFTFVQVAEELLYGPYGQLIKSIGLFAGVNADHSVYLNARTVLEVAHGALPSSLPTRRQLDLDANDVGAPTGPLLLSLDNEIRSGIKILTYGGRIHRIAVC